MRMALDEARDLKRAGVNLVVISVGPEKNVHLLKEIASTRSNYFEVESYEDLFDKIEVLKSGLTREVSRAFFKKKCNLNLVLEMTKSYRNFI